MKIWDLGSAKWSVRMTEWETNGTVSKISQVQFISPSMTSAQGFVLIAVICVELGKHSTGRVKRSEREWIWSWIEVYHRACSHCDVARPPVLSWKLRWPRSRHAVACYCAVVTVAHLRVQSLSHFASERHEFLTLVLFPLSGHHYANSNSRASTPKSYKLRAPSAPPCSQALNAPTRASN
jgi:hypothetical protein